MGKKPATHETQLKLDFGAQFHIKIRHGDMAGCWVPAPIPSSALPLKQKWYAQWQEEERQKLIGEGEAVLDPATDVVQRQVRDSFTDGDQ